MKADEVYAVLKKQIKNIQVSGGGVTDYVDLDGKPQINGVTLLGNLTSKDIGIPDLKILNEVVGPPVGEIISFMGTIAPPNYLICDGAVYPIADYPYLAQHFEDNFGSTYYFGGADGTFAVPDLKGEFLRGTGKNGHEGQGNGAAVGNHQNGSQIPIYAFGTGGEGQDVLSVYTDRNKSINFRNVDFVLQGTLGAFRIKTDKEFTQTTSAIYNVASLKPTNTSVLYCIKCKPTFGVHAQKNYSFDGHVVGTWVDGKPLYEKTVDFGNLPNADTKSVQHGIDNADYVWIYDGFVDQKNGSFASIAGTNPTLLSSGWTFWCDRNNVNCLTGLNRETYTAIVTLHYTKTTD